MSCVITMTMLGWSAVADHLRGDGRQSPGAPSPEDGFPLPRRLPPGCRPAARPAGASAAAGVAGPEPFLSTTPQRWVNMVSTPLQERQSPCLPTVGRAVPPRADRRRARLRALGAAPLGLGALRRAATAHPEPRQRRARALDMDPARRGGRAPRLNRRTPASGPTEHSWRSRADAGGPTSMEGAVTVPLRGLPSAPAWDRILGDSPRCPDVRVLILPGSWLRHRRPRRRC